MNNNLLGMIISFGYILLILLLVTALSERYKLSKEVARKAIHILLGNWIFVAFYYFDSPVFAGIIPAVFIVVNYLSYKYNIIKAMEREDDSLGTVWYAVSLFVIVVLAFIVNRPIIAYSSILILAYGDGLAAVIGKKFGQQIRNQYIHNKSLLGSMVMLIVSIIVTSACNIILLGRLEIIIVVLVSIIATLTEVLSHKGLDNLFLPITVAIFYLFATMDISNYYLLAAFTLLIVAVAFIKRALTSDGVIIAFITGITLFSLGGLNLWFTLILFFILGSLQSRLTNEKKKSAKRIESEKKGRNWVQVISNSLPSVIMVILYVVFKGENSLLFGAFVCFSSAAADTFSSEIGMMSKKNAVSIISLKPIKDGVSGGVTLLGFLGGLVGSAIISIFVFIKFGASFYGLAVLLGFLGTILDSILGATIQRKYFDDRGELTERKQIFGKDLRLASGISFIDNNMVNLITVSIISALGYYVFSIIK